MLSKQTPHNNWPYCAIEILSSRAKMARTSITLCATKAYSPCLMLPKRSSTTTWSECAACLKRFTGASQAKQGAVSHHNEFAKQNASTHKNRPPKETNYHWRWEDGAQFVS